MAGISQCILEHSMLALCGPRLQYISPFPVAVLIRTAVTDSELKDYTTHYPLNQLTTFVKSCSSCRLLRSVSELFSTSITEKNEQQMHSGGLFCFCFFHVYLLCLHFPFAKREMQDFSFVVLGGEVRVHFLTQLTSQNSDLLFHKPLFFLLPGFMQREMQ